MKKRAKRALKGVLIALGVVVCVVGIYVAYVCCSYYRLDDNIELNVDKTPEQTELDPTTTPSLSIVTDNMGYGTFSPDYTFFMDGGSSSKAQSKEVCEENISAENEELQELNPDFAFLQELDVDADRSYHFNESDLVRKLNADYNYTFAQNYDSPFLFYPLTDPIGATKSGMATLSKYTISSATRRSLPMPTGFSKFLDLDRCLSVSRVPLTTGKELVLINLHLSAYGKEDDTASKQVEYLMSIMQEEREQGNYVICGGDFNTDISGDPDAVDPNNPEWAEPFDFSLIPEGFTVASKEAFDEGHELPQTCRDGGKVVDENNQLRTLDTFIYSDNIACLDYQVIDLGFAHSDHNPCYMEFSLKE